jgi:hypothetical protein
MAYAYNPSCWGGWDQEDRGLRSVWANSSWNLISKITSAKWTGSVAQAVITYFASSNPSPTKKKVFKIGTIAIEWESISLIAKLLLQVCVPLHLTKYTLQFVALYECYFIHMCKACHERVSDFTLLVP